MLGQSLSKPTAVCTQHIAEAVVGTWTVGPVYEKIICLRRFPSERAMSYEDGDGDDDDVVCPWTREAEKENGERVGCEIFVLRN